jgi:GNAT superfamily N-acetyltransferase
MIRPVLYMDLPGIIYAINHRARSKQQELANFVCWLEPVENALPSPPILRNIFPLQSAARTWICEDHWRILGFAQVRERPARSAWDLSYLAAMSSSSEDRDLNLTSDDVLKALLEYTLEMAARQGALRIFARVEDERPELALFQRAGFQRYARELTYVYDPQNLASGSRLALAAAASELPSLRRWSRHHVWGLYQLYRSVTPQRVLTAERAEDSEEFARLHVGSLQPLPSLFSRRSENYVCDVGVRLGAWLRLTRGHGSVPHRVSLFVHPEHADLAAPLLRFGISRLLETDVRRIYCLVREYDSFVIAALRDSGFEQAVTRVLLVRHVALLATRQRTVPLLEPRAVYGLKGLGTVNSRQKIMR